MNIKISAYSNSYLEVHLNQAEGFIAKKERMISADEASELETKPRLMMISSFTP